MTRAHGSVSRSMIGAFGIASALILVSASLGDPIPDQLVQTFPLDDYKRELDG